MACVRRLKTKATETVSLTDNQPANSGKDVGDDDLDTACDDDKDLDGLRIEVEAFKAVMDVAQAEVNKEDLEKEINNIRNKISELEKRLENLSSVVGFIHVYTLPKIRA